MEVGESIGRYRVQRALGRGPWATVWLARDRELGRAVAIKQIAPEAPPVVAGAWREAAGLSHPNLVTVLEQLSERDFVMEYMPGGSLRPFVGRVTLPQLAGIVEAVCGALSHLAGAGLVHRDVKPENVLLTAEGRVKLGDLGIVGAIGAPAAETAVGTPQYIAPEQAMGQAPHPASDLYALGCMAFELLAGRLPFSDDGGGTSVMVRHVDEPVPWLADVAPGVTPWVAAWVRRLMAKRPEERPATATAAWEELEDVVVALCGPRWRREAALPADREAGRPKPARHPSMAMPVAPPAPAPPTLTDSVPIQPPPPPPSPAPEPAPFETWPPLASPEPALDDDLLFETWPPAEALPAPMQEYVPPVEAPAAPPPVAYVPPPSAPVPPPPGRVVARTPHVDLPPAVAPGQLFDVGVFLDRGPARANEQTEDVAVRVPAGVAEIALDVWLVATHHFVVVDAPVKRLRLGVDEARSETVSFRLAVQSAPAPGEEAVISAAFSHNGRPSGRVSATVAFAGAPPAPPLAPVPSAPAIEVDTRAVAPDLTVEIVAVENDDRRFEVRVSTPLLSLDRTTEPWWLPARSGELVTSAMQRFFAPDAGRAARLASLRGAGIEFYDAAPALFKDAFWRLHDAGIPPRNLYVVSDESSIPWELMIPHRRTAKGPESRDPLGVELAVGRWHRGTGVSPRQRVPLRTSLVVAPRYTGSRLLANAEEEAEYVCSAFDGRRIDPARFEHLDAVFAEGGADLLHFICHGEADRGGVQVLLLEDPDTLDAQQVRAMAGLGAACRDRRPLVFLNACEVGRPAPGLVGPSGFARSFIDVDVSGVVGTLWSVDDRTAHDVATRFYAGLVDDLPFAEILRRIRADGFAEDGDDSYAAYCFYGDPAARADRLRS